MRRGELIAGRFGFIGRIGGAKGRPLYECIDRASGQKRPQRVVVAPFADLPFHAQQRLARHERDIVARLSSPATLPLYDLVDTGRESFPVFASVGKLLPLESNMRRAPYHYIARLLGDLLRFAGAAHRQGVALRLLLPGHLMLTGDGRLVVIDCSHCTALGDEGAQPLLPLPQSAFVAPELTASGRATTASDVYALGMLSASLLAGRIPVTSDPRGGGRGRIREDLLRIVRRRFDNPEWIEPLAAALADAPRDRPRDVRSFFAALLPDEEFSDSPLISRESAPTFPERICTAPARRAAVIAALKADAREGRHGLASSLSDDDVRALVGSGRQPERIAAADLLLRSWSEARMLGRLKIVEESLPSEKLPARSRAFLQYCRGLRDYLDGNLDRTASALRSISAPPPAVRNLEGMIAQRRGRFGEAARAYEDALSTAERAGDDDNASIYRGNLALARQALGDYASALALYDVAIRALRGARNATALAAALFNKAGLITLFGHFGEAAKLLRQSLAIARAQGLARQEGLCLVLAAEICRFRGDFAGLEEAARRASAIFSWLGDRRQAARALLQLGWGALRRGDGRLLKDLLIRLRAMHGALPAAEALECRMLQICSLRQGSPAATEHMRSLIAEGEAGASADVPPPLTYEWKKLSAYVFSDAGLEDAADTAMRQATEALAAIEASIPPPYRRRFRSFMERERLAQWRPPERPIRHRRNAPMINATDPSPLIDAIAQALRGIVARAPKPTQQRLFLEDVARWVDAEAVARFRFLDGAVLPSAHTGEADLGDVALEIRKRLPALTAWKALELHTRGKDRTLLCAPTSSGGELTGCLAAILARDRRQFPKPAGDLFQSCADMLEVIEMTALQGAAEPAAEIAVPPPTGQKIAAPPFLFGISDAMGQVRAMAHQAASSRLPAIISGPPGTGKRTLAGHIHALSSADAGCEAVDCRQAEGSVLYAQLFGTRSTPGVIGRREQGTVVLLHLERLDWTMQNHLIAFLQEGCYRPAGADAFRKARTWLIATAYERLWDAVDAGRINPQLVALLGRLRISLPPLSEHAGDVEALATDHFEMRGVQKKLCPEALGELIAAPWEGNTAQLFRALDNAAAASRGASIDGECMRRVLASLSPAARSPLAARATLADLLRETEKAAIESALALHGHDKGEAARALGISIPSLYKKLKQFNLGTEKVTKPQLLAALRACAGNKKLAARQLGISRKTLYNKMAEYHLKG